MKKYSKYIIINFINDKGKDYLIYVINFDYENRIFYFTYKLSNSLIKKSINSNNN